MSRCREYFVGETKEVQGLYCIEPLDPGMNPYDWLKGSQGALEEKIKKYGGVLLRGFNLRSITEFNRFVQQFNPNLLDYTYRSTPRTNLGGKIYSSTEYPASKSIPFHNENSYSQKWPTVIFFFSVVIPDSGGQTPIARSSEVYQRIDTKVREKFETYGVMYVRNYNPGIDLSWEEVFCTEDKEKVNAFCERNNIAYEWKEGQCELTTKQVCQASFTDPVTHKKVWFNQAHLFHISSLLKEEQEVLITLLGKENIPRNAFYGNGEEISEEVIKHIRECYEQEKILFDWKQGDLMILDNIQMAHSREPYTGDRKVVVAMA